MSEYRTGNCWHRQTIIRVGTQPADAAGRRPDDQLVAVVDSGAPEGLAERICALLNGEPCRDPVTGMHLDPCACRPVAPADSCTCVGAFTDTQCPVHQGRRARGPKPPPVGPGCICDGSGRTCPRHGAVI